MKDEPRIAILIPAYNEEPVITETIYALAEAGIERENIFIVDDRSKDRTAAIARSRGVHVYTVPVNGGKARAQVAGLAHFKLTERFEWVAFLDGDTKVDPMFLLEIEKAIAEAPGTALFVGQVRSARNSHIFSAARANEYAWGQDIIKGGQSNFNTVYVSPGCASVYSTEILKRLTIDHMTLAEDMDLTMQVHRAGGRVRYVATAKVYTQDPNNLKDYHKQVLRWFRGFWQVVVKHEVLSLRSRKQIVDWYMLFLIFDAMFFNRVVLAAFTLLTHNTLSLMVVLSDAVAVTAISVYAGIITRRFDVIYKLPLYYWLSFLNLYAYFRAFIEIVILRKELLAWNKVKRYDFNV